MSETIRCPTSQGARNGIFAHFRKGVRPLNDVVQVITKSNLFSNYDYCSQKITSKLPEYIIDGNASTAWASRDTENPEEAHFIIDFMANTFYLESYSMWSICIHPNQWKVEGTNILNKDWVIVDQKAITEYREVPYKCNSPHTFRYFRFTQIKNFISNNRFHVAGIEFFGTLNPKFTQASCKRAAFHCNILIGVIQIFVCNK